MNYLSHFVIDNKPQQHYFNTALILPDITKKWIKTFKSPLPNPIFTPPQFELLAGSLQHYKSDQLFHASSFFAHYHHIINSKLKSLPFSQNVHRKWFIAHILTELLIDRRIVQSFPHLVDDFYESLLNVDDVVLSEFLQFYGMAETTDFFTFFNHFRDVKYIYYYADNNKFLYSLNKIITRVGIMELNTVDAELMLVAILNIEHDYLKDENSLLKELKQVFR